MQESKAVTARLAVSVDPALRRPGTFVHCQWWGRDPGDAHGSALTDALQYCIVPQ